MQMQSNRPVDWMEETVSRQADRLLRAAVAIMGCRADAEDAVQDAFVKLWEKQPSFESLEHETAWLVRVTVNLCRSRLRSPWRKRTTQLFDDYPAQTEQQQSLVQSVLALPQKHRTIIHLFYYEGYSTREIAQLTRQKDSTVRQQLTRARRELKLNLEGDEV